jgi:hypothetical protein
MSVFDAKGRDDQVDRFPDRYAQAAQVSKIGGRLQRQLTIQQAGGVKARHRALEECGMPLVARALQHFEQNEVADQYVAVLGRATEGFRLS